MKNKEKPKQKPKEFSVSPFKGLKGKALELREQPAPPAPQKAKEPVQPKAEQNDDLLFLEAVADVRRLRPAAAAPARPERSERKEQLDKEDQQAFLQAVTELKMDVRFSEELAEEEPQRRPASVNRLRQVRRGGIRIDLELDLHGLTKDEAIESLEHFVKGAYNRGQKGVLVITGKGNNSPDGEPVLKSAVTAWLREAGKTMVAEFAAAPREMGGSGAFLVFLKEKKTQEQP